MMNLTEHARAVLLAAMVLVSGCGYDRSLSARNVLGGNTAIGSLSGASTSLPLESASTPTVSMSRVEWEPIDFVVPVDGTVHGPLWRVSVRAEDDAPRSKGLYPTAESALDLDKHSWASAHEALLEPFVAVGNVIAMPVLAIMDPPGNHQSPSKKSLYKRSERGRSVAGTIPAPEPTP